MLQLCIGIDRLIGVIFPFWYKANGKYVTFKYIIGIFPENVKKLTISLSVLMSIALICYILNIFLYAIITPLLNFGAFTNEYFVLPICLVLQSMAYGSSAPVLYFCNGQYRRAFRTQFSHQEQQVAPAQHLGN
uniref:G_PROTEIN_RECEP_F1_2 domain-containing protein n=1 Tax=Globodera pallida TaxID=36090 RepID=A0A183BZ54_GLOPA